MKKIIYSVLLMALFSCGEETSLRERIVPIFDDSGRLNPDGGNNYTCISSLTFDNMSFWIREGDWVRISWSFTGCRNDKIILAVYRAGVFQQDLAYTTPSSLEAFWIVPPSYRYGGSQNIQLKMLLASDRSELASSSYFDYSNCYGSGGPSPDELEKFDTYIIGKSYLAGVPTCKLWGIGSVKLVLTSGAKRFVIKENINRGETVVYTMPSIPSGNYRWQWEIPGRPSWINYVFEKYILVKRDNFDGLATICNAGNLRTGDLTSVNWSPDIFVDSQVLINIYKSGVLIYRTPTYLNNNGKYVFSVSEGNNYTVCVQSQYNAFFACSAPFNVGPLPGVIQWDYNPDKSNCILM